LAQGAKLLTREIWAQLTYACKILFGSVNVCPSYSRKADFEEMHKSMSRYAMTAYNFTRQLSTGDFLFW